MAISRKKLPTVTPETFEGLTLMRMRTEYIKRVRIIDLTFTEPLTLIGGDNSNGKTSYLDSMDWCLGGKSVIQMDPIHHGRQTGSMLCEFGDGKTVALAVTRTLKRVGDDEFTADVEVDIPGHIAPTRIQDFLDKLAGRISFDPMAFDRLKDAERFETLRKLVSGFDFTQNAADNKKLYAERTNVNRDLNREQSAADAITAPEQAPCEQVDESALTLELQEAGKKNLHRASRQTNRQAGVEKIAQLRAAADGVSNRVVAAATERRVAFERFQQQESLRIASLEEQVQLLMRQMEDIRQGITTESGRVDDNIQAHTDRLNEEATQQRAQADAIQKKIDEAGELPEEIDTAAISAKLTEARTTNAKHAAWKQLRDRKAEHQKNATGHADESDRLTKAIDALDAARQKAILDAKLPVDGLGFGDDFITLNKVPWSQAGRAERVDASTAIAMAFHPKLKVILIRDGSDLGRAMRDRIRGRAEMLGYRVLMEVIDDSPNTHVVIEDGEVKERDLVSTNTPRTEAHG